MRARRRCSASSRLIADPENEDAEFAVMVRSDMKGRGLGYRLMNELIGYARGRGLHSLSGDVIAANTTMIRMADELGFARLPSDEPSLVRVRIDLARSAP